MRCNPQGSSCLLRQPVNLQASHDRHRSANRTSNSGRGVLSAMLRNASSSRRSTSGRGLATAPDGSMAPDRPPSSGCARQGFESKAVPFVTLSLGDTDGNTAPSTCLRARAKLKVKVSKRG